MKRQLYAPVDATAVLFFKRAYEGCFERYHGCDDTSQRNLIGHYEHVKPFVPQQQQ